MSRKMTLKKTLAITGAHVIGTADTLSVFTPCQVFVVDEYTRAVSIDTVFAYCPKQDYPIFGREDNYRQIYMTQDAAIKIARKGGKQ